MDALLVLCWAGVALLQEKPSDHQCHHASYHLYGPDDTDLCILLHFSGDSEVQSSHFRLDDKP